MITVYVCSREEWEKNSMYNSNYPIHLFPETLYSYKDWFSFYSGLGDDEQVVVSQSSELLKSLSHQNQSYKIYLWEDEWVLYEDADRVRMLLLECYEKLMFKKFLFED